jgi:RNA polymerase sigma-70 factor (ECF subfamily)
MFDQDRSLWNQSLVHEGLKLMELSASGPELTEYHIEAAIAAAHSTASKPEDTNWETIISLYDELIAIRPSPIVALNRAIAVAERDGPERGLQELDAIEDRGRLAEFYSAALGELELRRGRREIARAHFRAALALARNPMEHRFLEKRVCTCE